MLSFYIAHGTRLDTLPEQRAQGKEWLPKPVMMTLLMSHSAGLTRSNDYSAANMNLRSGNH
jgi:hypothetical protein